MSTTLSDRPTTKRKQYVRILLLQCLLIGFLPLMPPQWEPAVAQVPISTQPSLSNHPLVDDAFLVRDIRQTPNTILNDLKYPANFFTSTTMMFFWASDVVHGDELWATDGTTNGTRMLRDINPGRRSSHIYAGTSSGGTINNQVFFAATDGIATGLWMSDGTSAGTRVVKTFTQLTLTNTTLNNAIVFSATDNEYGSELWRSDGTVQGTFRLRDIANGFDSSTPANFIRVNNKVFFTATTPAYGTELWVTDGTTSGTRVVRDIRPGSLSSTVPYSFSRSALGDVLLFTADDGITGRELWRSDGTTSGTVLVKNMTPGGQSSSFSASSVTINSIVYFIADDGSTGAELWRSDGTASGTSLVRDINSTEYDSIYLYNELVVLGSTIYFSANDGTTGSELWRSDGTAQGTLLVKDADPGQRGIDPDELTAVWK